MQTLPTPEEALAALKSQPGIDLTKQKKGTRIIVETDSLLFEIVVLDPGRRLIEVASTTPLLREPTIGQYLSWRLRSGRQRGDRPLDRPHDADVPSLSQWRFPDRPGRHGQHCWPRLDLRRVLTL